MSMTPGTPKRAYGEGDPAFSLPKSITDLENMVVHAWENDPERLLKALQNTPGLAVALANLPKLQQMRAYQNVTLSTKFNQAQTEINALLGVVKKKDQELEELRWSNRAGWGAAGVLGLTTVLTLLLAGKHRDAPPPSNRLSDVLIQRKNTAESQQKHPFTALSQFMEEAEHKDWFKAAESDLYTAKMALKTNEYTKAASHMRKAIQAITRYANALYQRSDPEGRLIDEYMAEARKLEIITKTVENLRAREAVR